MQQQADRGVPRGVGQARPRVHAAGFGVALDIPDPERPRPPILHGRRRTQRPVREHRQHEGGLRADAADEPDALIEQLRADEAIAAADTLMLTVPTQLGVDYNAHIIEGVVKDVAPGWGGAEGVRTP